MRIHPILLIAISALTCEDMGTINPVPQPTQDETLREIVYRDLFQRMDWGAGLPYSFFFIGYVVTDSAGFLDHKVDPPDLFMTRFLNNQPPVKMMSQMVLRDFGYYDSLSGSRGVFFDTWPPKWISTTNVTVEGSYFYGSRNAQGYRYYLRYSRPVWIIDSVKITWAS